METGVKSAPPILVRSSILPETSWIIAEVARTEHSLDAKVFRVQSHLLGLFSHMQVMTDIYQQRGKSHGNLQTAIGRAPEIRPDWHTITCLIVPVDRAPVGNMAIPPGRVQSCGFSAPLGPTLQAVFE